MAFIPNANEIVCSSCGNIAVLKVVIPGDKVRPEERVFQCRSCGDVETVIGLDPTPPA
jgi:uncharacterized Zn finger protein